MAAESFAEPSTPLMAPEVERLPEGIQVLLRKDGAEWDLKKGKIAESQDDRYVVQLIDTLANVTVHLHELELVRRPQRNAPQLAHPCYTRAARDYGYSRRHASSTRSRLASTCRPLPRSPLRCGLPRRIESSSSRVRRGTARALSSVRPLAAAGNGVGRH